MIARRADTTQRRFRNSLSDVQLVEQSLGLFQIERVEAFGEPAIDRGEKIAGLLPLALIAPEPRHAHRRAQYRRGVRLVRVTICSTVLICGFALPGQAQQGPVFCGWIGVKVSPMTRPFADSLGMVKPYGAIFGQPRLGSPAAQAGIEPGDAIIAINGAPLARASDFATIISKWAPGSVIYLTAFRNGELMEIKLTLGYSNCKLRSSAHRNSKT
jgi:PDZ domain